MRRHLTDNQMLWPNNKVEPNYGCIPTIKTHSDKFGVHSFVSLMYIGFLIWLSWSIYILDVLPQHINNLG